MSQLEITCVLCGKKFPKEMDDESLEFISKLAPQWINRFACDDCVANVEMAKSEDSKQSECVDAQAVTRERLKAWESQDMCPEEFRRYDSSKIPDDSWTGFNKATSWEYNKRGMMLFGPTGKCKTRAAYATLKRIYMEGKTVIPMTANKFAVDCATCAADSTERLAKWLNRMKWTDVLFLDDLGKRTMSEFAESQLFDVLDTRFSHGKPIVITSEGTSVELGATFAQKRRESFIRRIVQYCDLISFGHPLQKY